MASTLEKVKPAKVIADKMADLIENGIVPWRKPWTGEGIRLDGPQNAITNRPYSGANRWYLFAVALAKGYCDPRWLTFKQAQSKGGTVRKGEKGTSVIFWNIKEVADANAPGGKKKIAFCRIYYVFNVMQCDGVTFPEIKPREVKEWTPDEKVTACVTSLAEWYDTDGAPSLHHGYDAAYYAPDTDSVHMPNRETFNRPVDYAQVLAHETIHATGHKSRLDRLDAKRKGDNAYAIEELTAELGACTYLDAFDLLSEVEEPSAAYLKSWASRFRNDPDIFISAASRADKALALLLGTAEEADQGEE